MKITFNLSAPISLLALVCVTLFFGRVETAFAQGSINAGASSSPTPGANTNSNSSILAYPSTTGLTSNVWNSASSTYALALASGVTQISLVNPFAFVVNPFLAIDQTQLGITLNGVTTVPVLKPSDVGTEVPVTIKSVAVADAAVVPEPASLGLMAFSGAALLLLGRRQRM